MRSKWLFRSPVLLVCCLIVVVGITLWTPFSMRNAGNNEVVGTRSGSSTVGKMKKVMSQRKQKVKGKMNYDHPNLFAEWHQGIRTKAGDTAPTYEANYKMKALLKARSLSSTRELSLLGQRPGIHQLMWTERGPGNVSGRARAVVIDPDDPLQNTWYIGSVGGGIWKTSDAGKSWQELTTGLSNLATSALAMAPSNHKVMYLGTGEGFGNLDQIGGNGVWKSIDRGKTWEQMDYTANHPDFKNITRIIVHPASEDTVLVSTTPAKGFVYRGARPYSKIFRTTDGGRIWEQMYSSEYDVQHLIADPDNFNIQYATLNSKGVIKSINGGKTWTEVWQAPQKIRRLEIAIAPSKTSRIYLSAEERGSKSYLYASDDAGGTWANVKIDPGQKLVSWLGGQGWYDNTIAVHPLDESQVFVGGIGLFKLDVSGIGSAAPSMRWTVIADVYRRWGGEPKGVHPDQHNILFVPLDGQKQIYRMVVANDGGVTYSDDMGDTFVGTLNGCNTTQFYGVDKMNGADRYIGGTQDNGTWVSPVDPNSRTAWKSAPSGDGFEALWHYKDPNKLMESSQFNSLWRSLDGGKSWKPLRGFTDVGSDKAPFFTKLAKSKQDPDLVFAVGKSGVWRTDNFGEIWTLTSMPKSWSGNSSYSQVKISLCNPQVVWTGRGMSDKDSLFLSLDGGLSFERVSGTYKDAKLGVFTGFQTHPTDEKTAYAIFSFANAPKIIRTTDFGKTWEDITGFGSGKVSRNGFPDVTVYSLLVMPYDTNVLWAGTEIGIFRSDNGGKNWYYADNGLPPFAVYEMVIVNDEVVIATHGRGIWSVSIPQLKGYEPKPVVLSPRFRKLSGGAAGFIKAEVLLPSAFDSSVVIVDGVSRIKFPANKTILDTTVSFISAASKVRNSIISLQCYKNKQIFRSSNIPVKVYPLNSLKAAYVTNFNQPSQDWIGSGFTISNTIKGFSSGALHTPHNYPDLGNMVQILTTPILVDKDSARAILSFREVVIVEPGEKGTVFGDPNFWDYAVVEGSNNKGVSWKPLADGYDSRADSVWLAAYRGLKAGDSTMFRKRTINLQDRFMPGDTLLVRFRLYADSNTNGWGWVIDDLKIQENSVLAINERDKVSKEFHLSQNYPNPFNPTTTIEYRLLKPGKVMLTVYNVLGQKVITLVNTRQVAGEHSVIWNGIDQFGKPVASGMYFYRMEADKMVKQKKMLLVK